MTQLVGRLRRAGSPRWDLRNIDPIGEGHHYAVFSKLAKQGLGPTDSLAVTHSFYVTSEESADRVSRALEADGYATTVPLKLEAPDAGEPQEWEFYATRVEAISIEGMLATRAKFESLMHVENGDYDGWDARPPRTDLA